MSEEEIKLDRYAKFRKLGQFQVGCRVLQSLCAGTVLRLLTPGGAWHWGGAGRGVRSAACVAVGKRAGQGHCARIGAGGGRGLTLRWRVPAMLAGVRGQGRRLARRCGGAPGCERGGAVSGNGQLRAAS
jgi:hypothetical protein